MLPILHFFLRFALAIQGLLCFHANFKILCSVSVKNDTNIMIGIALNLLISLGSLYILTV